MAMVVGGTITGLGVMRGLGRGGLRSILIAHLPGSERRSRYCTYRHDLERAPKSLEDYLEAMMAAASRFGLDRTVVIPCSDEATHHIARLPAEHRQRFLTCLSHPDTLDALTHKGSLSRLLTTHSVPHPRTRLLTSAADLDLEESQFEHVFLKPCESQSFFRAYGVKGITVKSRDEARARFQQVANDGHEMILQQYIPGPSSNHFFVDGIVDQHGEVRAVFARQRLRMYPPDYGNSCYQVSVPREQLRQPIDALTRLLSAISYRGLFSAEFKRDDRDGEYKLLEINCRPWWYIDYAHLCGLPLAEMTYADALGWPLPTISSYAEEVPQVYPYYDYSACQLRIADRQMTRGEWLSSWLFAKQAMGSWRDPVPSIVDLAGGVYRYLKPGKASH